MKCDYHMHSDFSDDSRTPMEVQVERAIELGLDEICFTEHVDYGIKEDWGSEKVFYRDGKPIFNANYPEYFRAIEINREKFAGKIKIKAGLEFGVQTHTIKRFQDLFAKYRDKLDFTLLSIHQVGDREFWLPEFRRGKTCIDCNEEYYNEMLEVVKNFHDYSGLAHMDLLRRYGLAGDFPFENNRDVIAEILTLAINDGKGLEMNTASWRYKLNDTQPCREILKLYRDLGGEILTLGSDAHSPEYLGTHMDEARSILRELGFKTFCTFTMMQPEYHVL